jgi:hypothetical protein
MRTDAGDSTQEAPTPVEEPRVWAIGWDDVGYPAPTR